MTFRQFGRDHPAWRSWLAVGLMLIGLVLGGVWALTLVGLTIEGIMRLLPLRLG